MLNIIDAIGSIARAATTSAFALMIIVAFACPNRARAQSGEHFAQMTDRPGGGMTQDRRGTDRGGRGSGVGTGIAIGIGTGILLDAIERKRQQDQVSSDDGPPPRKKGKKTKRTTKRGKDDKDDGGKSGGGMGGNGDGGKTYDEAGKKDGAGKRGKDDDSGKNDDQAGKTDEGTGKGGGGKGGNDGGGKIIDKTVANKNKCCSCVESMKLVYQGIGPKTKPEGLVDVPDVEGEGIHKEKTTFRPMPSHNFQVEIFFKNHKSDELGSISLKWFERTDHPPPVAALAGMEANKWADMQNLMTTSNVRVKKKPPYTEAGPNDKPEDITTIGKISQKPGTTPGEWYSKYVMNKALQCADPKKLETVQVKDQPSSYTPRRLDFHIVAESPRTCECKIAALELYATQLLTMEKKDKEATEKNQVSQDTGNAGFYGPNGKMKRGENIPGVPPAAPQPQLPAGF